MSAFREPLTDAEWFARWRAEIITAVEQATGVPGQMIDMGDRAPCTIRVPGVGYVTVSAADSPRVVATNVLACARAAQAFGARKLTEDCAMCGAPPGRKCINVFAGNRDVELDWFHLRPPPSATVIAAADPEPPRTAGNVLELARKADPVVVEQLEQLLADAKAGKITGLVALTNEAGGYRGWESGRWDARDALYMFEQWKHRVLFGGGG